MVQKAESTIKLIAYYLPQFHEIPENNEAWGKGFTEWRNVKKAVPLYDGHNQPREPLSDNYYSLLDIETMKWQASLAEKYGIYGFCFYHYWFKDGRKVLEKPAEMLLSHQEVEMPFCFSWANEPWTKSWHGAAGEKEILLEQGYGSEEQWRKHFEYLFPFFCDERYIKVDGKPVFLIYQINKIGCFNRMVDYWNNLAVSRGLPGIYIVDMLTNDGKRSYNKRVSATVDFQPGKIQRRLKSRSCEEGGCRKLSYDDNCFFMLNEIHKKNEFRCVFIDYDDTPRRGMKGVVYEGSSPEKFGRYLQKTIELSTKEESGFIFVNAWNEWGEGNYLEPDKKNGYAYLEAVQMAMKGECSDIEIVSREPAYKKDEAKAEKYRQYYELCNRWIKNTNDKYHIEDWFYDRQYYNIAVYGMGELGNRLIEALEGTQVHVQYGINKNMWDAFAEIPIRGLDEEAFFGEIDCIVVTPVHLYSEIADELKVKADCEIVSLEEVIYGM